MLNAMSTLKSQPLVRVASVFAVIRAKTATELETSEKWKMEIKHIWKMALWNIANLKITNLEIEKMNNWKTE